MKKLGLARGYGKKNFQVMTVDCEGVPDKIVRQFQTERGAWAYIARKQAKAEEEKC